MCWFRLPNNIGCGLNSILYVPPTDEQLREISSVAAGEEHARGESSYHKYQLMSLIRKEYRSSKVTLANGEIGSNPAHFDVYHLVTGFAGMMALSQNAAYRDLDSDARSTLNSASLVDEPQPTVGQGYPIQEGANFNTTDETDYSPDEADYSQVPTSYPQMVTITSAQQNRLLSLLEQGLSILTPNNPTSASFAAYAVMPFSLPYSQRWKMAYEHESLCKLHTAYDYPARFDKKGRCFYKLENYIADRCIPKVHYFWTRRREKELWLAMQYAKWDAAVKPVSKPLRFFNEHGEACNVPTDDLCNIGVKTDRSRVINGPDEGELEAVLSKPAEDEKVSANATFVSPRYLCETLWDGYCQSGVSVHGSSCESTKVHYPRFHKLAIQCKVAHVAASKGVKMSQDGTVYSELLTRVQSKPEVWKGMVYALERLPTEVSNSIEAMFTIEGRKKGFLNSLTASVRKVFDYDASEKIIDVSEKIITLSPENVIALSTTSREGADKNSYQAGADNESSGACTMPLRHPQKCVLPVPWIARKAGRPSAIPRWSDATKVDRFSQIPLGAGI